MHLLSLVQNMPKEGFDITVAFFKEEAQEARSLVPDFQALGVKVLNLDMAHWGDISALRRLYHLLKQNTFDIIHTHLFRADVFGPLLARLTGVPVVVSTVHNAERFFKNPIVKLVLRSVNYYVNQVIAISYAVKKSLLEDLGLPPEKVQVIYYGIEVEPNGNNPSGGSDAVREALGLPKDAVVIGTVGRLSGQKGHRYLIEAFGQVHRTHPNTRLLIVGHDDEGLRPKLENLAVRLGIGDEVLLPGYMDGRRAMEAMDIFVLSSLWEGFGLVLLEAMLAQLPIVATNISAIPEIIVAGETGILVPAADPETMAEAILYLLENPDRVRGLGYRGREHLVQRFSLGRMVEETVALYVEAIGNDIVG